MQEVTYLPLQTGSAAPERGELFSILNHLTALDIRNLGVAILLVLLMLSAALTLVLVVAPLSWTLCARMTRPWRNNCTSRTSAARLRSGYCKASII